MKILDNFFQAEDGIRDVERSRGLGDVYKRQVAEKNMVKIASHEFGAHKKFYFSVYGHEVSDYTLMVVLSRFSNGDSG